MAHATGCRWAGSPTGAGPRGAAVVLATATSTAVASFLVIRSFGTGVTVARPLGPLLLTARLVTWGVPGGLLLGGLVLGARRTPWGPVRAPGRRAGRAGAGADRGADAGREPQPEGLA
ncbi:hypothetical protein [Streptomyces purpureus]|uniref:Uncharacterized protein n=1 Tax=Streptomyces purpureus TaxID=1951 RepID=A0A918HGV1_9ACTN|nr:hypothetical protein [Streptomyces purpureus]GGT59924.1 hypothetical protein GCM10014713_61750 [Streptomyces purpureus]